MYVPQRWTKHLEELRASAVDETVARDVGDGRALVPEHYVMPAAPIAAARTLDGVQVGEAPSRGASAQDHHSGYSDYSGYSGGGYLGQPPARMVRAAPRPPGGAARRAQPAPG